MSALHELKTWPGPFAAILDGRKRFEVRRGDRAFAAGDEVVLREWAPGRPGRCGYTGREVHAVITYVVRPVDCPPAWGLSGDVVVFGFAEVLR